MQKENKNVGLKSSVVGVIFNVLLFVMKFMVGTIFHSVSIMADAMNNFSDLLSSMIAFVGFKMSEKPADKEHPFGHERFEYISGFLITVIMLYIGFDVFKSSIESIINHDVLVLDQLMIYVMIASVFIKGFLYFYYMYQYQSQDSEVLLAAAYDSRNDVLISIGILFGFLLSFLFDFNVDAHIGLLIALFILVSSLGLIKGFMNELVGVRPSQSLINSVIEVVEKESRVFAYHDLMIHEYGDSTYYGTIHLEVDERLTLTKAHDIADNIETEVKKRTGVELVVHLDPIDVVSDEIKKIHKDVKDALKTLDTRFSFHDLRLTDGVVELDVVLFEDNPFTGSEITKTICDFIGKQYEIKITYDAIELKDNM